MGRGQHSNPIFRRFVLQYRNDGLTFSEISKKLNCSRKKVYNAIKHYEKNQSFESITRKRSRITSQRTDHLIVKMSKSDPFLTAPRIREQIQEQLGINISTSTIKNRLRENNLFGRIARRKPHVSQKNRIIRVNFAKVHLEKPLSYWNNVLFTDESKFNRFASDGKSYVRRNINTEFDPRYTTKTIKHGGGSVLVWGGFSWYGVGPITRIEGIMDQLAYKNILMNIMLPYAEEDMPLKWKLVQDNDPKHTAKSVKKWISDNKIEVVPWPAQSPDLNPIENLWHDVDKRIDRSNATNMNILWTEIQKAWYSIPLERCQSLIQSMHRRFTAVVKNKGFPTQY